ncbi:MAG: glycoside hydrolase family 31 protein [Bacilli bacterium]
MSEAGIPLKENIYTGAYYRISLLSDVLIRFEYSKTGIFLDNKTLLVNNRCFSEKVETVIKEDDKFLNIETSSYIIEYSKEKPFKSSDLLPDSNLRVTIKGTDKIWYVSSPEVRNLLSSPYSLEDKKINLKKGLYSFDGYASIDDSSSPIYDKDNNIIKNINEETDIYLFIYKNDFKSCLESYYSLTGYPELLPRYALGVWWSKSEEYTSNDYLNIIKEFKNNNIPFSILLLNSSWHKTTINNKYISGGYTFNKDLFKNKDFFINNIKQDKLHLVASLDTSSSVYNTDIMYPNIKKSLNIEEEKEIPLNVYSSLHLKIFTSLLIKNVLMQGIDGIWLDNKTSVDKVKEYIETTSILNTFENKRGLVLTRNYGIASHRAAVLYSGYTEGSWKTLKTLPYINLTSSNMGLSWWSHDIGGFSGGIEDSELYIRYVMLGVYSPIFRFTSDKGHYYKKEPWRWDIKTLGIVKDYIRLRHKLIPYIYTEAYNYSTKGLPLITPVYYTYPLIYDEPLYKNEYYFGREIFVSPITTPKDKIMNRVVHNLFLPDGIWYDFKTGKKYNGNKRYVTFYKDEDYPVFVSSGAIIPKNILNNNDLFNTESSNNMEIEVFPGKSNTYILYEDDGETKNYKNGYYIKTSIEYIYKENEYILNIIPIEGKSNIIPNLRDYTINFRNTKNVESVEVKVDSNIPEYKGIYDKENFKVNIKDVPSTSKLSVIIKGKTLEIESSRLINEDIDSIINDLGIETKLKENIANIIFSDEEIRLKRISIRKLKYKGLESVFIRMFIKLLELIDVET